MKNSIVLSAVIAGTILFATCNNSGTTSGTEKAKAGAEETTLGAQTVSLKSVAQDAPCLANAAWFPITPAPDNANPDSQGDCGFYKWAWQEFLFITQPDGNAGQSPRFLAFTTPTELFKDHSTPMFSKAKTMLSKAALANEPRLLLSPRLIKDSTSTSLDGVAQAGSNRFLVDKNGKVIYYAQHINTTFVNFIVKNGYTNMQKLHDADTSQVFPVGSLELKSSWKIVMPGEDASGFYTTQARVARLVNGKDSGGNTVITIDPTKTEIHTVALLGLHVVGVVEGHPEFIWATFEHNNLAPNLNGIDPHAAVPVDNDPSHHFLLYKTGALAKDCNAKSTLVLDEANQTLSPIISAFHQFAFDETAATPDPDIKSLNEDVRNKLAGVKPLSIWANYSLKGAVWLGNPAKDFVLNGPAFKNVKNNDSDTFIAGDKQLSNVTMETFTQSGSRCFNCHRPYNESKPGVTFPAKRIGISHVLTNAYLNSQQHEISVQKINSIKRMKLHK